MELKNSDTSVEKLLPAERHYFKIPLGLEKKRKENNTKQLSSTLLLLLDLLQNTQYLCYLLHCGLKEEN